LYRKQSVSVAFGYFYHLFIVLKNALCLILV
jgi:hypothetical protein